MKIYAWARLRAFTGVCGMQDWYERDRGKESVEIFSQPVLVQSLREEFDLLNKKPATPAIAGLVPTKGNVDLAFLSADNASHDAHCWIVGLKVKKPMELTMGN